MREAPASVRTPSRGGSNRNTRGGRNRSNRPPVVEEANEKYYVVVSRPDTPVRKTGHPSLASAEVHAASLVDRYSNYGYTWDGDATRGVAMFQEGERKIEISIEHP